MKQHKHTDSPSADFMYAMYVWRRFVSVILLSAFVIIIIYWEAQAQAQHNVEYTTPSWLYSIYIRW